MQSDKYNFIRIVDWPNSSGGLTYKIHQTKTSITEMSKPYFVTQSVNAHVIVVIHLGVVCVDKFSVFRLNFCVGQLTHWNTVINPSRTKWNGFIFWENNEVLTHDWNMNTEQYGKHDSPTSDLPLSFSETGILYSRIIYRTAWKHFKASLHSFFAIQRNHTIFLLG